MGAFGLHFVRRPDSLGGIITSRLKPSGWQAEAYTCIISSRPKPILQFQHLGGIRIMKRTFNLAATVALLFGAVQAYGQSFTADFQDGTDDGFGLKFNNDASASFPIVNIGGSLRMGILRTGAFQEADRASQGNDAFLAAMNAAVSNPSGYVISYDWYVDTSLSPG